jgi:Transposase and inactivated derivatives
MPDYRRARIAGGTYFFTVNLLSRQDDALVRHIDLLRACVRAVRARRPFVSDAWVVLPDHLHAIWTLPPGDEDYSVRWMDIKRRFALALPRTEWLSEVRQGRRERGIWQRRFWEHAIRDEEDFRRHIDYIHYNPVKHGCVSRAADWPYSTFRRYVQRALLPLEWASEPQADEINFGE